MFIPQLISVRPLSARRERLAEAYRVRDVTETMSCPQIGLAGRRAMTLSLSGHGAIDFWRLGQIAEVLAVSLDWLKGRSNVMDVKEIPELELEPPEPPKKKAQIK